ncbi:MAG: DUF2760 domain-containing protein [Desulfobacterales bacterium]
MEAFKIFSRSELARVLFVMAVSASVVAGAAYWGLRLLSAKTMVLAGIAEAPPEIALFAQWVAGLRSAFLTMFLPAVVVIFLLLGLILWGMSRRHFRRRVLPLLERRVKAPSAKPKAAETIQEPVEPDKRLFLYLISVLQREARLLDFFSEDLSAYEDAQIGAAVRSIHDSGRRTLEKYLAPEAVIAEAEGQEVTVDKDFDPNRMKLSGNVTGSPPFRGTVRHRGWKARKIELPSFSGRQDPGLIAPAEIEVR